MSHGSGSWKSEIRVSARSVSSESSLSGCRLPTSCRILTAQKQQASSLASNPIQEGLHHPHDLNTSWRTPPPNNSTLGIRLQHRDFGGDRSIQSIRMASHLGPLKASTWRRKWQPTPVTLPGKSHGRRSLAGYSPWGCKESDTTEQLTNTHTHARTHSVFPTIWIYNCISI